MTRFDFQHPPFDVLTPHERETLSRSADIVFFAQNEALMLPGQTVEHFYVVIKGIISELADDEIIAAYRTHDSLDARALIAGHSPHRFEAHEEALLFALPKAVVLELIDDNPLFGAFFFQSLSQKFSALSQQRSSNRELQTLLTATVREANIKTPVFLPATASVLDAAQAMKREKVKSILVQDGDRIGMFTTSDFRDVIIQNQPSDTPLLSLARFNLITTDRNDFLFNALLTMTRHTIQRVVVTENNVPVGILEQVDLLSYFSNHSHLIAEQIERADSLDDLESIASQLDKLIKVLSGHGVKAPQLGRLIQALNMQLFARIWRFIAPEDLQENSCLVVMGSEGRGEQIIKTDQDNALIVRDGFECPELEAICEQFSATLIRFGFPPCPGKIMVNNPIWRHPLQAFRDQIYHWLYLPQADSMMNLAIFIDAHAVTGDASLLDNLKLYLSELMSDDVGFYMQFARAIDLFDETPSFFSQLLSRDKGSETFDLKKGGIFPIVHGVRTLALEKQIAETNTFDRLHLLAERGHLDPELAHDTAEALTFLLELRLQARLTQLTLGSEGNNLVHPARLSTLERDLLKDALTVIKRFKATIRHHFKLGSL